MPNILLRVFIPDWLFLARVAIGWKLAEFLKPNYQDGLERNKIFLNLLAAESG
jgi:hypothetical protein